MRMEAFFLLFRAQIGERVLVRLLCFLLLCFCAQVYV